MDPQSQTAVCVRYASKSYGKKLVLENLDMHVEKGIIYGLLGSSGCGKTTLLNCIVGRKHLDSGTVWVLGGAPGSSESGIPGPRVGFMPQDTALVAEFTVKACIYYFGRIFCMNDSEIKERFDYLTKLLDLPPGHRVIANCSGGQQRRISFAAALVSNPELLILDEPTVGMDPVLRESIWNYLVRITENHRASVIITTHYIEETRQAHKIGLMRNGRLLAQESPHILLTRFGTNSLEDVFLTLCMQQTQGTLVKIQAIDEISDSNMMGIDSSTSTIGPTEIGLSQEILYTREDKKRSKNNTANAFSLNGHRIKALFGKSWLQVSRNYSGIAFMLVFPMLEIFAFFLAVGDDVKNIRIATINHEDKFGVCGNYMQNLSAIPVGENRCTFEHLGCRFMEFLNNPMIDPVFYDDINKAKDDITHGDVAGALYIPENFSVAFQDKLIEGLTDNKTLNDSQIQVWLDMSNRQIGAALRVKLVDSLVSFLKSVFSDCNYLDKYAAIPINFEEHVYGHLNDTFLVFMVPGVLLTIIYFMGTSNSSSIMITERLEGIWDRSIIAGVSSLEIVLAHFVTQLLIIVVQSALILLFAFAIYRTEYIGTFAYIIIFVILQGVAGIAFGFFVSIISNSHSMANILATGSFYPMIVLCGMIWPLEGMPEVLRWISQCLPFTLPIVALRNIMQKGWNIFHYQVVAGIWVPMVYIVVFLSISILGLKRRT